MESKFWIGIEVVVVVVVVTPNFFNIEIIVAKYSVINCCVLTEPYFLILGMAWW